MSFFRPLVALIRSSRNFRYLLPKSIAKLSTVVQFRLLTHHLLESAMTGHGQKEQTLDSKADCCVCLITAPASVSPVLSRSIIEKKLAACVNAIPSVKSYYEWEGKIEEDQEDLLVVKTTKSAVSSLNEFLNDNHPYNVHELITLDIATGNKEYMEWINKLVVPAGLDRKK